jgi:hypothetical protein
MRAPLSWLKDYVDMAITITQSSKRPMPAGRGSGRASD